MNQKARRLWRKQAQDLLNKFSLVGTVTIREHWIYFRIKAHCELCQNQKALHGDTLKCFIHACDEWFEESPFYKLIINVFGYTTIYID